MSVITEYNEERTHRLLKNEGRVEGKTEAIKMMLKKLTPKEIAALGFSEEEIALAQE